MDPPRPEEVRVEGLTLDRFEAGRLRARTRAVSATVDRSAGTVRAEQVQASVYEDRDPVAEISAGRTEGRIDGHSVLATRGVRVTDREGRRMDTAEAVWLLDLGRVLAPGAVTFRGQNFEARGSSMAVDLATRQIEVAGPIGARVDSSAQPLPEPRSR